MQSLITSYLLQAGKCALPDIGIFKIAHKPAKIDIANKQMLPPVEEITFIEQAIFLSPGLINYIALKKNIPSGDAENLLNGFCKEWKEKIEAGEALCFESVGCLQKNDNGVILFRKEEGPAYFKPISAERVLHENIEHMVLVGDKETTSTMMNEYYKENMPVAKKGWVVGAVALGIISLVILCYSFYNPKVSFSKIGNRSHFNIKSADATHFKP